jgi:hypothetical protein
MALNIGKGPWWPCRCGGWAWASKSTCPKCSARGPTWARAYCTAHPTDKCAGAGFAGKGGKTGSRPAAPRSADGTTPEPVTIGDFVCVPSGRKQRRAAKRAATQLADLSAQVQAAAVAGYVPKAAPPGRQPDATTVSTTAAAVDTSQADQKTQDDEQVVAKLKVVHDKIRDFRAIPAHLREELFAAAGGFEAVLAKLECEKAELGAAKRSNLSLADQLDSAVVFEKRLAKHQEAADS